MSDELEQNAVENNQQAAPPQLTEDVIAANYWDDTPKPKQDVALEEKPKIEEKPTVTEEKPNIDYNSFVKEHLGFENIDAAKEQINKWKEIKPAEEIKFENEESKKLFEYIKAGEEKEDEVLDILQQRKQLKSIDKMNAEDVLKLHIQQTNKHYKPQDVQDIFEEKYQKPSKPEQSLNEDDADFEKRENEWKISCEKIDRKIERDAYSAKTELSGMVSKIVFPEIEKPKPQEQVDPEIEAKTQKIKEDFWRAFDSEYKSFNGFETKYQDKEVEIPISFTLTEQDKEDFKKEIEDGFDVESFIGNRWFNKDGKPNVSQIMADKTYFKFGDKIFQKFAQDAGARRLDAYIKDKKNIQFDDGNKQQTFAPAAGNLEDKVAESFWS